MKVGEVMKNNRPIYPNELFHHGIKNQHWGVRNGPPYPLNRKTSARIKRGYNERVRYSAKEYQEMRSGKRKTTNKDKSGVSHYGNYQEGRLREVNSFSDIPQPVSAAYMYGNAEAEGRQWGMKSSKGLTMQDVQVTNLGYQQALQTGEDGFFNNCMKCTATLALRKQGYDVIAGRSSSGMLNAATEYWFNGAVPYKEKGIENIEARLAKAGHNGYGNISMRRADGSGHAVFFQRSRTENGYVTEFIDGQNGQVYGNLRDLISAEGFDTSQFARITRLDNTTPNWAHMEEDSVIRRHFGNDNMNRIAEVDKRTGNVIGMFNTGTRWTG